MPYQKLPMKAYYVRTNRFVMNFSNFYLIENNEDYYMIWRGAFTYQKPQIIQFRDYEVIADNYNTKGQFATTIYHDLISLLRALRERYLKLNLGIDIIEINIYRLLTDQDNLIRETIKKLL